MKHFVTHLESAWDGTRFEAGRVHTTHAGRPLWVRYDLDGIRAAVGPNVLQSRQQSLWRYRELLPLPLDEAPVTLGEGMTPLLPCSRLGREMGFSRLHVKDESQLPTGSFKSRGMTVAVSMAQHFGLRKLAIPTAGNAGAALAAYGARAGMEVYVFMPEDTPRINQIETHLAGARVVLVGGLINDCGQLVRKGAQQMGWFDVSTLKEPYRIEGKKTMGLELAEQLSWTLPDAIFYPTGGGTGLIGMWKAFQELRQLGWLRSDKMPRLVACQSDGCAPIVKAFETGARLAQPFPDPRSCASGVRVPAALGDFMILDAVRESGGWAVSAKEGRIREWMHKVAALEGIGICPEAAVCFDCLETLRLDGRIEADAEVVVFNTAGVQKYAELIDVPLPRVRIGAPLDYESLTLPSDGKR
jgi:threonine synthase